MDSFATGRGILAADLNRLASDAARRGLAGSAYLAHSNGFELVQRNPRRQRPVRAGGECVALVDEHTVDPATGETVPEWARNLRLVVDWKYDAADRRFKVLYGTLALFGVALAVVPDVDADGRPLWSDGGAGTPSGPFGGGGVQAVEESY